MLTQEHIDFFHTHGYLIMRGLIGGRELAVLQEQADRVIAQGLAGQGEHHLYRPGASGRKTYWRSEEMWQRDPIFLAVTVHPDLLENIGQCLGQAFYPWNDSLVVKVAQAGAPVERRQCGGGPVLVDQRLLHGHVGGQHRLGRRPKAGTQHQRGTDRDEPPHARITRPPRASLRPS